MRYDIKVFKCWLINLWRNVRGVWIEEGVVRYKIPGWLVCLCGWLVCLCGWLESLPSGLESVPGRQESSRVRCEV